jgi:hypothetical protein
MSQTPEHTDPKLNNVVIAMLNQNNLKELNTNCNCDSSFTIRFNEFLSLKTEISINKNVLKNLLNEPKSLIKDTSVEEKKSKEIKRLKNHLSDLIIKSDNIRDSIKNPLCNCWIVPEESVFADQWVFNDPTTGMTYYNEDGVRFYSTSEDPVTQIYITPVEYAKGNITYTSLRGDTLTCCSNHSMFLPRSILNLTAVSNKTDYERIYSNAFAAIEEKMTAPKSPKKGPKNKYQTIKTSEIFGIYVLFYDIKGTTILCYDDCDCIREKNYEKYITDTINKMKPIKNLMENHEELYKVLQTKIKIFYDQIHSLGQGIIEQKSFHKQSSVFSSNITKIENSISTTRKKYQTALMKADIDLKQQIILWETKVNSLIDNKTATNYEDPNYNFVLPPFETMIEDNRGNYLISEKITKYLSLMSQSTDENKNEKTINSVKKKIIDLYKEDLLYERKKINPLTDISSESKRRFIQNAEIVKQSCKKEYDNTLNKLDLEHKNLQGQLENILNQIANKNSSLQQLERIINDSLESVYIDIKYMIYLIEGVYIKINTENDFIYKDLNLYETPLEYHNRSFEVQKNFKAFLNAIAVENKNLLLELKKLKESHFFKNADVDLDSLERSAKNFFEERSKPVVETKKETKKETKETKEDLSLNDELLNEFNAQMGNFTPTKKTRTKSAKDNSDESTKKTRTKTAKDNSDETPAKPVKKTRTKTAKDNSDETPAKPVKKILTKNNKKTPTKSAIET